MLGNILIVLACVGASVLALFAITRSSPVHARKESNDFTGAVVSVIGTTYAVLLAFMLFTVWTMFQQAQVNAEQEANDLVNVFRISAELPDPARSTIQDLTRRYAQHAVAIEFPAMTTEILPPEGGRMVNQMWKVAGGVQPHSSEESQALGELTNTLRNLTEHRRIRIMQSHETLPPILWTVLIAGGIITVAASCFFGVSNFRFHLLQVIVLSFLIALVLVAIADIDSPYQGDVKVSPAGFEFALHTFSGDGEQ